MASKPSKPKKKASKGSAPKMTPAQQSALFVKTAKEVGVDESGKAFERAIKEVVKVKSPTKTRGL